MPKLPVPVPPADDIDGFADERVLFVIPAQRRPVAPGPEALRGITPTWLPASETTAAIGGERRAA